MSRKSLSIRHIRVLALGSLVLIIAVVTAVGYRAVSGIESGLQNITDDHWSKFYRVDDLVGGFVTVRGNLTSFVVEEQENPVEILRELKTLIERSETILEEFQHKHQEDKQALELFIQKLKEYRAAMVAYSQELLLRRTGEGVRSWERTLLEIETEAHGIISGLKEQIHNEVIVLEEVMLARGRKMRNWMALLGLFGLILAVALAFLMHRALSRPILELIEVSEAIASGDLTRDIRRSSDDEVGSLTVAIAAMLTNLRRTVGEVQGTVVKVAEAAHGVEHYTAEVSKSSTLQGKMVGEVESSIRHMDSLVDSVNNQFTLLAEALDDSSASTLELKASIEEVSGYADNMADEVENINSSLVQMTATVGQNVELLNSLSAASQQTAQTVKSLASSSEEVGEHAKESRRLAEQVTQLAGDKGAGALSTAIEVTRNNRELIDNYSKVIHSLGDKSDSIGEILEVIHGVADQTNLLSINAAIIAAQAGEHGRGFAVVAEEVGSLSETTTASIKRVEEVIQSVREDVANAVKMMAQVVEGAEQSIKSAERAGEVFREIEESTLNSTQRAREIADASIQQVAQNQEILEVVSRNLEEVVSIQRAMEEQQAGQDLIVSSAEKIRNVSRELKQSANEQSREGAVITKAVTDTHEFSRKIQEAMDGEKKASEEIVASLDRITEATFGITSALGSLEDLVADLSSLAEKLGPEVSRFKLPGN
jgi:methyl-accepting chemotaxis protein